MAFRIFKITASAGGWILFFLLLWQVRERLQFKISSWLPLFQEKSKWQQIIALKEADLRETSWKDQRPLILMLGDSQVEMANWYDLFQGRFAIRNAGLSQAKIADVSKLAESTPRIQPAIVLLFCGINDLGAGHSADDAFADYIQLLNQVCKGRSHRVMVISIMPVAERRLGEGSKDLNTKVHALNAKLQRHCEQAGIAFVDVSPGITQNGFLREDMTWDGLHLNPAGYHHLAASIQRSLLRLYDQIETK